MATSQRFAVATHILTALKYDEAEKISSDFLAKTVNTNPVVVRRIVGLLRDAKLVNSTAGAFGGTWLAIDPTQINLLDIYNAVEKGNLVQMHHPNKKCPIGACIEKLIRPTLDKATLAFKKQLADKSLADLKRDANANMHSA